MAISKKEFASLLANRLEKTDKEAMEIIDAYTETLFDIFKTGNGVSITGLGGFYLDRRRSGTAFKFNPSQRLKKLLGWSSSYKGKV